VSNSKGKILNERTDSDSRRKGLVIVAVLWVVMILNVIVATAGRNGRLDMKVRQVRTEEYRCKWACRAGTERAIGVLNEDLRESDCLGDLWSDNDEDFNNVSLERCLFSVRVIDESGKLNINTVTRGQLLALPYMEPYIADAIIDWRDDNDAISGEGVEGGYYQSLAFGYEIRNGSFKTIRELLLVKGVTEELFYGEDTNLNGRLDYNERDGNRSPPADDGDNELDRGWISYLSCYSYDRNTDAAGNNRININQADAGQLETSLGIRRSVANWIVERRERDQFDSIADLIDNSSPARPVGGSQGDSEPMDVQTFSQIADRITVDNSTLIPGKVNINTASKEVLAALFGDNDEAVKTAEDIIAYRAGLVYGMQSIAELLNVLSVDNFKNIANLVTTRSNVFTIRCFATADRGSSDGIIMQSEAVADRSSNPCRVLYWYQGGSN